MTSRRFDEMDRMFAEMDRLFDRFGRGFGPRDREREFGASASTFDVSVDLQTGEEAYTLLADLPGFETGEIDLTFEDGVLSIDAEHEVAGETGARSRRVHERVRLPAEVDEEAIEASYRNGVLEVTLPRTEPGESGRRIDID